MTIGLPITNSSLCLCVGWLCVPVAHQQLRRSPVNVTGDAHAKAGHCKFGEAGESLSVGYPDRFREINLTLNSPAGRGWSAVSRGDGSTFRNQGDCVSYVVTNGRNQPSPKLPRLSVPNSTTARSS